MKTIPIFYLILQLLQIVYAIFDIDELKSFNYGIDIRNEPVVMKSESEDEADVNTVHLTSKYGQPYQCSFPNTIEHEKQKEEAEKVALETGIPDLLKPMESAPCLRKTKDWWSYEFCYGKHIKQFHTADDGRIEGEIILLGNFESEYNWDEDSDKSDTEKRRNKVRRYHTQQYVNGSKCDLNGQLRKTEVRFICEEGSADYISRLDEPETCVYIMTIHTMRICHHPFLKPPTPTQTVTITCNPLLTVIQYQDYLDELEAKEEKERLEEEERQREEEEQKRIQEEKAKYYKENNFDTDEDGEVEVEDEEPTSPADLSTGNQDSLFGGDWSSLLKDANAGGDGSPVQMKTMYKVVQSPEDLKDFLKDTIQEIKKIKAEKKSAETGEKEESEEEEGEDGEKKIEVPKISNKGQPPTYKHLDTDAETDEELNDPDLEELDTEIKTLKDRYKNRKNRLTDIKNKVRSSMESQYESIIKEAKEELAQDGLETEEQVKENRQAIRQLTKTIDNLLNKLDKTEQEIKAVDKELEQFAEYDSEEKDVKSIPPVKDTDTHTAVSPAKGPTKTESSDDSRVKVRVRRIKQGDKNALSSDLQNKQTAELEKSVQKELQKAGLGDGDTIQVKIITTGYVDGDDETMHVLSEQESETFRNMIVDMIGGQSEVDREQARHDKQEENYSFVWSRNKPTHPQTPVITDGTTDTEHTIDTEGTTDTEGTRNTEEYSSKVLDTQENNEDDLIKEAEES